VVTVERELESLIDLIEAQIPANPRSPRSRRMALRIERMIKRYFSNLENALSEDILEELYYKYVIQEAAMRKGAWDGIHSTLDPILAMLHEPLRAELASQEVAIYVNGSAQMTTWGHTKAGIPIAYEGPPIEQAIDWAEKHCATLVTKMDEETKKRLAKTISDGITNKRGIPGLARDIRGEFVDMRRYRAVMIARTETASALSSASIDTMKDMGISGKQWIWPGTSDCDICSENEAAGVIPVDDTFPSGDMAPPAHPNCLLPDVRVEAPLTISGSRAFYNGDAIEFTTENGHKLTITPNHMILTPSGFIKAKTLKESDYIISCLDSKRITSSIDPYNDYRPAFIEDIWNSLMMQNGMVLNMVKTSTEDFYGDAGFFDGDIDIINPDSFLMGDINHSLRLEHISKHDFCWGDTKSFSLPSLSSLFLFGDRVFSPSNSFMGFGSQGTAFRRGQPAHCDNISLATIPRRDTNIEQSPTDSSPAYTELSRQFQFRFASLITPEQIIKIRNYNYAGHVYDLQSLEQLYIANNIIVKNCECALAPAILGS